jgi:ribosomal protein S18 acetylase RimI-like enzyme
MLIRALTEADEAAFWALRLRSLTEHPDAFGTSPEEQAAPADVLAARFRDEYIAPPENNFILGAFDDNGEMTGIVSLRREPRKKLRHKGTVFGVYVAPGSRQRGVARAMLLELIRRAKEMEGLEQINLMVMSANTRAKNLYASLGFETYGTEKHAMKMGETYYDEDLMVLFI